MIVALASWSIRTGGDVSEFFGRWEPPKRTKNTKPLNFRDTYSFRFWLALVTLTLMTQSVMFKFLTTFRTIPSLRSSVDRATVS